jgi:hypothetical protein
LGPPREPRDEGRGSSGIPYSSPNCRHTSRSSVRAIHAPARPVQERLLIERSAELLRARIGRRSGSSATPAARHRHRPG